MQPNHQQKQMLRNTEKMKGEIQKMQETLNKTLFEASTGGGMVTAVVTGGETLVSLKIAPEVVDPEEVEMLQEMILGAFNQALQLANDAMEKENSKLMKDFGLAGFL